MSPSRLKLNPTKTEVLWLGSSQQLSQISIIDILLQSTTIRVGESTRDLGVIIDSNCRCRHMCRRLVSIIYRRQLRPMLRSLTQEAARTLIQAFISSLVAWIIATHCFTVCPTILSEELSPSRTPLLGFSLEPENAIISRRFCGSCTGCQFRDALTTK